jgi:hypothetical protein
MRCASLGRRGRGETSASEQQDGKLNCENSKDDYGDHQCGHGWLLKVSSREPAFPLCFPGLHEALAR